MKHYVYKITNNLNGHYYIGKRKHATPETDTYMGSGKLIKEAVNKYGKSSFTKEIIKIFDTDEEAAAYEASLVTPESILDPACYNMHSGGYGGFEHINNDPVMRKKASDAARKYNQENGLGGTSRWSESSWERVRAFGFVSGDPRQALAVTASLTPESQAKKRATCRRNKSHHGERNSAWGTKFYVPPTCVDLNSEKRRFKEGYQPEGWLTTSEFRNSLKDSRNFSTGKHWYNDGSNSYLLDPADPKTSGLNKGRLGTYKQNSLKVEAEG